MSKHGKAVSIHSFKYFLIRYTRDDPPAAGALLSLNGPEIQEHAILELWSTQDITAKIDEAVREQKRTPSMKRRAR